MGSNLKTNMGQQEMAAIIKAQLQDMPSWSIEKQAIKGTNSTGRCYALGGAYASIVAQDPVADQEAMDKIVSVFFNGQEEQKED